MQIMWHGRDGRGGKEHGKDHSILTVKIQPALAAQHANPMFKIEAKPSQAERKLKLLPGVNDGISPKDWEDAKKLDLVKVYLREKKLEVIDAETLNEMDAPTAKTLVAETIDLPLLKKWRAADKRDDVVKYIDDHIAKLTAKPVEAKK